MGPKLNMLNQWISSPCQDEEIDTGPLEIGGRNCNLRLGRKLGSKLENELVLTWFKVEETSRGSGHGGRRVRLYAGHVLGWFGHVG